MRKLAFFVLTGFAVALLGACSAQPPRQAAEGYLEALARLDFDAASQFVAVEGKSNFEFLKKLYADLNAEEQKKFQVTDWKVTGDTITGDTATVDFVFDQVKKGQLSLRLVNGQWKVDHRQTF